MPRKLRNPKIRRGTVEVSDALFIALTWGDWDKAHEAQRRDGSNKWELFNLLQNHDRIWATIEPDALREWTVVYPGTRPAAWWVYSAPELRQIFGRFTVGAGNGRCQSTGVPYGEPDDWDDLPMVESTPAYLDRLSLWLDGERASVPVEAFEAQPFAWTLTRPPNAAPDNDDE